MPREQALTDEVVFHIHSLRKENTRIVLGRVPIKKEHIKVIEKIIKKRLNPADFYIELGRPEYFGVVGYPRHTEDHARYLPKNLRRYRYLRVRAKLPNLKVEFSPFKTVISAQRIYANGEVLSNIDETMKDLKGYLENTQSTYFRGINRLFSSLKFIKSRRRRVFKGII